MVAIMKMPEFTFTGYVCEDIDLAQEFILKKLGDPADYCFMSVYTIDHQDIRG